MAIAHRKEFLEDQDYQEGDIIVLISDGPSLLEHAGLSKPQPVYGFFKKHGNRGKLKVDGKNALNCSLMKRLQGEKGTRKASSPKAPAQASVKEVGKPTVLKGVNWVPNSIKGGNKQDIAITPEQIHNSHEAGRFLLWSRLTNMFPSSYSFGKLAKVGDEIVTYVSDLKLDIVDSVSSFIGDIAAKRILICKPHEAIGFIAVQLLMAAKENEDKELELFVIDVLEPACSYLKKRFNTEVVEKREKLGANNVDPVIGLPKDTIQSPFAYEEETIPATYPEHSEEEIVEEENVDG